MSRWIIAYALGALLMTIAQVVGLFFLHWLDEALLRHQSRARLCTLVLVIGLGWPISLALGIWITRAADQKANKRTEATS